MARFKDMPMDPAQMMLYSTSVDEALPAGSDVRGFRDVMECLNYCALESKCSSTGRPPYHPQVMAKVLGYAYSKGVRSSRRIEELLNVDVRYIWLSGGLKPDHNTIARFRKDNWHELELLFKDSVRVCCEAGLVYLNAVATDGSKIAAAASNRCVYGKSRLERALAGVERILKEAEEVDSAEDETYGAGTGNELPEDLRHLPTRRAKLEEIAKQLKKSGRTTVVETDADARVMKTRDGTRPCYNLQASVDAENQIIVAMKLTQSENDVGKLPEMVEEVESITGLSPDISLADAGYPNEETLKWLDETDHDALMPLQGQPQESARNDLFCSKCFLLDDEQDLLICPAGRKLVFKGIYKTGSGHYRQYAASGCKSCSFCKQCVGKGKSSRIISISVVAKQRAAMQKRMNILMEKSCMLYGRRQWSRYLGRSKPIVASIDSCVGASRVRLRRSRWHAWRIM